MYAQFVPAFAATLCASPVAPKRRGERTHRYTNYTPYTPYCVYTPYSMYTPLHTVHYVHTVLYVLLAAVSCPRHVDCGNVLDMVFLRHTISVV